MKLIQQAMRQHLLRLIFTFLVMSTGVHAQPIRTVNTQHDDAAAQQAGRASPQAQPPRDHAPHRRASDQERSNQRRKHRPMGIDQIDQAIETLREMHPEGKAEWLKRIEKLAKDQPEEAARRLSRFPRLRELMHLRANKPDEFAWHVKQAQLMREVVPLARRLREAKDQGHSEQADELKAQLRSQIEQLLEVRLKLKAFEISRIRAKLERAEQELAEIKANAEPLIDKKVNELMQRTHRRDDHEKKRKGSKQPGAQPNHRRKDRLSSSITLAEPHASATKILGNLS